jgi:uncharacterized protein (DUF58 family)
MKKPHYLQDLFLTNRFFLCWGILGMLFVFSYFNPGLLLVSKAVFILLLLLVFIDYTVLFFTKSRILCLRKVSELLSNGDDNTIKLLINNSYGIKLNARIIDELPVQFQRRDFALSKLLLPNTKIEIPYTIRPTQRGEYHFGQVHVFISNLIGFVERRYSSLQDETVKVYPSFIQLKKFQIHTMPDRKAQSGGRVTYRRGISTEFDHIKEYNRGDDVRTINWKASARKDQLMVNSFMDEKSQHIYCIIDKGRLMKMPFEGLSLLDYSINAALMFSYVALQKDDKIGIITFSDKLNDVIQPSKSKKQFNTILESLYRQETNFLESNYADLYAKLNKGMGQRSLLILFTNFETYSGFERQLSYLRALNRKHLLCVVIFENTEVSRIHELRGDSMEDIYVKTIADQFTYQKKMIMKELIKSGILAIFTPPSKLTVNVVNKYLELKSRQII